MKTALRFLLACILSAQLCLAQAPAGAPAGATGLCKDGTYYNGATKQGACRGHKGVKEWWGATAATPSANTPAASSRPATAPPAKTPGSMSAPSGAAGANQVWVNTATNVYHCPGTRYYGKTKAGAYMTESEAIAKGARPERGKACK